MSSKLSQLLPSCSVKAYLRITVLLCVIEPFPVFSHDPLSRGEMSRFVYRTRSRFIDCVCCSWSMLNKAESWVQMTLVIFWFYLRVLSTKSSAEVGIHVFKWLVYAANEHPLKADSHIRLKQCTFVYLGNLGQHTPPPTYRRVSESWTDVPLANTNEYVEGDLHGEIMGES